MTGAARPTDRYRILCVDGGGIRGLIPALVLAELERRLAARAGAGARIADYFHLLAGTSTGGLIALALTTPDPADPRRPRVSASELAAFYVEDGPEVFDRSAWQRIRTVDGFTGPKYSPAALARTVERRLGSARLGHATRPSATSRWSTRRSRPRRRPPTFPRTSSPAWRSSTVACSRPTR
jgi:patatin-like phospholipase/acyl hydrolase